MPNHAFMHPMELQIKCYGQSQHYVMMQELSIENCIAFIYSFPKNCVKSIAFFVNIWEWNHQIWEKNKGTIICDRRTIKFDIGIAQCDNGTIKFDKKNKGIT